MKKKLRIPLLTAGFLTVFCLGFLLAGMTIPCSFDQLSPKRSVTSPARASESIAILHEGTYPGFSDTPVTAEQAAPSQQVLNALDRQKYTWAFPLLRPRNGGIAIYELTGCSPEYIAYWDGRHLWLPKGFEGPWVGYAPTSPEELDQALRIACQ